jgi:ubiquinone/menaquinone biosynthesis C-methylase UbiE
VTLVAPRCAPKGNGRSAQANFDRIAHLYRWAEYLCLGPWLSRTRNHFLPQLIGARHALVLGDGDGRFLARLLHRAPQVNVIAVDTSAVMLRLLGRRCAFANDRLRLLRCSATALPPTLDLSSTDLIVTHFFLDCLSAAELAALAQRLSSSTSSSCLWVISDFSVPERQPWRLLARVYIRLLYLAFRLLTGLQPQELPDIEGAMQGAGFHRIARAERLRGLLFSELWQR